jgi:SAM-dependent methyltransferase
VDVRAYNRRAWDREVDLGNPWTKPVSSQEITAARRGQWQILLTPTLPVPRAWFPDLTGCEVLCLAGGGGQQGPILAAAGGKVTVFDNSPRQLEQDRSVAERDDLLLKTIEGDMADLSIFPDNHFDLIFHPVSNLFVPNVLPVWRECYRVLKPGGVLLSGFANPIIYIFDGEALEQGKMIVKYSIPYSDLFSLTSEERKQFPGENEPLEFGHTLGDQIGGQVDAGFVISGFYEDIQPESPLAKIIPTFIATRAQKPFNV